LQQYTYYFIITCHLHKEASGHEGGLIIVLDLYGIVASFLLTISCVTVYLNIKDKVRLHPTKKLLSFFLAPVVILLVFLMNYTKDDIWQLYAIIFVCFFLSHFIHYFGFLKLAAPITGQETPEHQQV
jgi:heme/copper-type cytochrome/quinol oxidase subunit 4